MSKPLLVVLAWLLLTQYATGQSFTCPIGRQPSCLDYSDKVCSSFSKCVDQTATCFDQFTCNYEGFMCVSDHADYVRKAKLMAEGYDDFKGCVVRAMDMEAVQACISRDNLR